MTCKKIQPRLSAWLDDELDSARASKIDAHLRDCDACRQVAADLRAMVAAASGVDPKDAPLATFSAILSRLDERKRARPFFPRFAFAAAALATMAAVVWVIWPRVEVDSPSLAKRGSAAALTVESRADRRLLASAKRELARAELHYRRAIQSLRKMATEDADAWPKKRKRHYEHKLAQIEATVARYRRTAGLAPVDPGVQQMLFGAYRAQIGYMQRAILDDGMPSVIPATLERRQ